MKTVRLIILIMLTICTSWASETKTEKVIVTGVGIDKEKAIKSANQAAIQQAVGAYVVGDSIVSNGKLIKDQILSQSNGYVVSFKTLREGKNEDSLYEIEAEIEVEVGKLTNKLGQMNIAMKNVIDNNIVAMSLSKFDAQSDFRSMADKIIFEPLRDNKQIYDIKILKFEPIDDFNEDDIEWGEYSKHTENKKRASDGELNPYKLTFSISLNATYYDSLVDFISKTSESFTNTEPNYEGIKQSVVFYKNGKIYKNFKLAPRNAKLLDSLYKDNFETNKLYPRFQISLSDSNSEPYQTAIYTCTGRENYEYDSYSVRLLKSDFFFQQSLNSLIGNEVFGIEVSNQKAFKKKNIESSVVIYLSKEDVLQIKNAKIEINWIDINTNKKVKE